MSLRKPLSVAISLFFLILPVNPSNSSEMGANQFSPPQVPAIPEISIIEPLAAAPGDTVTIIGSNFNPIPSENRVLFGPFFAEAIAASATSLAVQIPPNAITGSIPVGTVVGNLTSGLIDFHVDPDSGKRPINEEDVEAGFVVGEVLIFFASEQNSHLLDGLKSEFGFRSLIEYPTLGFFRGILEIPSLEQTELVVDLLSGDPRISNVFFNRLVDITQSDPSADDQLWLQSLGLPEGWETFFPNRGQGVRIAIIDTGADLDLPQPGSPELELDASAPNGLNFSPDQSDSTAEDELGHGTAVSTIAIGAANGFNGMGVAPDASVISLKVFTVVGGRVKATNEGVAQALSSAFKLGADVINMSLGCEGCSPESEQALREYYEEVINKLIAEANSSGRSVPVLVASTGNDGEPLIDAPAAHSNVIGVGSVSSSLQRRSGFSNYGPELDFLAYGEAPATTLRGGRFASAGSGTSFSAPQVAGLAALILGESPSLSARGVKERIIDCFVIDIGPPGYDEETGWGRIEIPSIADAPAGCLP